MPTVSVNLSTTEYVQVNSGLNPILLHAPGDAVRIALSAAKPARNNEVFHVLTDKHPPLPFPSIDVNVWALATTDTSSLIATETDPLSISVVEGTNPIANRHFHRDLGTGNTLAVASSAGDYQVTVADGSAYAVGNVVEISNGSIEFTHPRITGITTDVLTFDRQLDSDHPIGTDVLIVEEDLSSAVGSMASPVSYKVHAEAGEILHLYRLMIAMTDDTNGDLGTFGGMAALTNGVTIRLYKNGVFTTFTNWKTNAGIKLDFFDVEFDTRSGGGPGPGGGGTAGVTGRGTFEKLGSVLELVGDDGDYIEALVQDDLSALVGFSMSAQGHLEN